ncbi:hypothetical protein OESDEN_01883 [Oesophagostomum dentatum]|uniref:Uncharacterized protein n=1 Tax=Oesophagostomum dentatum TaxID=61180 RepID=A0A0B1TS14_OESDE|nr:hypothetical protein OESDEN_01883 [Oesophagostomum dentatum]
MSAAKDNVLCEVNRLKKELTTKEECLCKRNVEAEEEKTQLSSRISELEEDLMAERSIKQALEGQLFKCHEEIAAKNTELNAKMDQLEHLDEELKVLQTDKAVAEDECKELREKDAVRSVQLGELTDRTRLIEEAIAMSNERSSKLEAENLSLKYLVELYDRGFLRGSTSEGGDWLSSPRQKSEALPYENTDITTEISPLFTTSVDEPSMMEARSLLGPSDAIGIPTPYPLDNKDFLLKKIAPKSDAATSVSDLTLLASTQADSVSNLTTTMTGSDFSLATTVFSQGRQSLARSEFSRPSISGLSMNSRKLEDLPATDRARLKELQKRNERLHPAMRCAYATEVAGYASPSGSENVVKNGVQSSRRKGKKLMERAASYVKKRLPLSESTNSLH